jgi:serine protease Do
MPSGSGRFATRPRGPAAIVMAAALLGVGCTPGEGEPEEAEAPEEQPDEQPTDDPAQDPQDDPAETAPPEPGSQIDIVALVQEFAPQTVAVEVALDQPGQAAQGAGSGVIWQPDGVIVTNHHVVAEASEITVVLADGTRYDAEPIASDPRTDVALIRIEADGLPTATFAEELPQIGEPAIAIGNPLGFQNTVTAGIVSGVDRSLPIIPGQPPLVGLIQTDAAISSGNSGGALVGADGTAIGINVAVVDGGEAPGVAQGLGFAIPATTVTSVAQQLLEDGEVRHAYLGIAGVSLTPQLSERFGLDEDRGALVGEVEPGGPADDAGMQQGDVIVELDGESVPDLGTLLALLRDREPGGEVTVGFVRDGEAQTVEVVLDELPEEEAAPAEPLPDDLEEPDGLP